MNVGEAYRGGTRGGNNEPMYHTPTMPVYYAYPAAAPMPPHMSYAPYAQQPQQAFAYSDAQQQQQQQQQAMYIPAAYMNYYMPPPMPHHHQFQQQHYVQQQHQGNNNARKEPATQ